MTQSPDTNRRIVLAQRPKGLPDNNTLRLETVDVPVPESGQMLLRTRYLSIDPYMRGRMNDAKSYAEPVKIGEVMTGQVVAEVVQSDIEGFNKGDYVLAGSGWQDYAVSDGQDVLNLGKSPEKSSWSLGVLGMPGYTAYAGLLKIGEPRAGETVVVAAASGPVGATVGQIAKIKGCRVVGVAGGEDKCRHVVEKLGFDVCILPEGPDYGPAIMGTMLRMKVKLQGFIIFDSFPQSTYQEFRDDMLQWLEQGRITYTEQIVDGLEQAPAALNDVLTGNSFGKVVVEVNKQ